MLGVVRDITGAPSGMRAFPLLFNVFFAAILLVALERLSEDADTLADLAHLQEQPSKVGSETARNVCGVVIGGCCMLTTRASCRGRRASWSG